MKTEAPLAEEASAPVSSILAEATALTAGRREKERARRLPLICLTTLGVVFGDIGTSPLYALRECFRSEEGATHLAPTAANVLGILSLITWALLLIISVKYLLYVMRADNKGEGGILALLAVLSRRGPKRVVFIALSIFGAALLYGDGMLTPAISVLSAIEGLKIATPVFQPYAVPIAIIILVALFSVQKYGTAKVGLVFGPLMLLWFVVLALLGVCAIIRQPFVFAALNPWHALEFILRNRWLGFVTLGAVFLVVTGGEALYADLGHFGRRPIRLAWFLIVLPALLLNYFGQGALILTDPTNVAHPFFQLAPRWAMYPMVALATCAAVIASQAVISGVFSLTRQAVLLDEFPRVDIQQTSGEELGQVYVPVMNWFLLIACISLVLAFPSSSKLAAAYGVAVSTTMVITTILLATIARVLWKWHWLAITLVTAAFLVVDLAFFGANLLKFFVGGWFPLLIGGLVFTVMTTWKHGHDLLEKRLRAESMPLADFLTAIGRKPPLRVPGISVFITGHSVDTPPVLRHQLKHNQALTETAILLRVETQPVPHVPHAQRRQLEKLRHGFYRVTLSFGFMDEPNVAAALQDLFAEEGTNESEINTYYIGRGHIFPRARRPGMTRWRAELFAFLFRNATQPVEFFNLPTSRVVELGIEVEI